MAHCVVMVACPDHYQRRLWKHMFFTFACADLCVTLKSIFLKKKRINTDNSTFAVCLLLWLLAICSCSAHLQCGRAPSAPHIRNTLPHLAETIVVWICGGRDKANESTMRWRCSRRHGGIKKKKKMVFSHLLKCVFSCTCAWNKSAHSLEQTL